MREKRNIKFLQKLFKHDQVFLGKMEKLSEAIFFFGLNNKIIGKVSRTY